MRVYIFIVALIGIGGSCHGYIIGDRGKFEYVDPFAVEVSPDAPFSSSGGPSAKLFWSLFGGGSNSVGVTTAPTSWQQVLQNKFPFLSSLFPQRMQMPGNQGYPSYGVPVTGYPTYRPPVFWPYPDYYPSAVNGNDDAVAVSAPGSNNVGYAYPRPNIQLQLPQHSGRNEKDIK